MNTAVTKATSTLRTYELQTELSPLTSFPPIENVKDVELGQPIPINIENGISAMAMAQLNGCTAEELRNGMKTYGGVDRRFDFKIKNDRHVFLSDYAHHQRRYYRVQRV